MRPVYNSALKLLAISLMAFPTISAQAKTAEITILKCSKTPSPDKYFEHDNNVDLKGLLRSFEVTLTVDLDNKDPSGIISIQGKGELLGDNYSEPIEILYPKGVLKSGYQQLTDHVVIRPNYKSDAFILGKNGFKKAAKDTWIQANKHDYMAGGADFRIVLDRKSVSPILLASGCNWNWSYNGKKHFVSKYITDRTED